jgi:hypothetical protein
VQRRVEVRPGSRDHIEVRKSGGGTSRYEDGTPSTLGGPILMEEFGLAHPLSAQRGIVAASTSLDGAPSWLRSVRASDASIQVGGPLAGQGRHLRGEEAVFRKKIYPVAALSTGVGGSTAESCFATQQPPPRSPGTLPRTPAAQLAQGAQIVWATRLQPAERLLPHLSDRAVVSATPESPVAGAS